MTNLNDRRNFGSGNGRREDGQLGSGSFTDDVVDTNAEQRGAGAFVPKCQVDPGPTTHLQAAYLYVDGRRVDGVGKHTVGGDDPDRPVRPVVPGRSSLIADVGRGVVRE